VQPGGTAHHWRPALTYLAELSADGEERAVGVVEATSTEGHTATREGERRLAPTPLDAPAIQNEMNRNVWKSQSLILFLS
jgi:hypothetical protein